MSVVYKVKAVNGEPREWSSSKGGSFLSYKVDLEHDGGVERGVEWTKKPESQPPKEDELVAGHIEPRDDFPDRFKIDYDATKELSQGQRPSAVSSPRSGGSKGNWEPESQRDPERSARILRQHSQSVALQYLALSGFHVDPENRMVALEQNVKPLIDWFDQDVIQAGQAANQGAGAASSSLPGDSPGDSPRTTPAPDSPPASTQQAEEAHQLDEALDRLGVFLADERRWLIKAWEELPALDGKSADERRTLSRAALVMGDLEAQNVALKRLREIAGPMPDSFKDDEDPIPF